jgi:penicillin-binding protein 1C
LRRGAVGLLLAIALLWLADRIWPLPMPGDDLARVVLAEDGTPLWRFADADGVWRYPVSPDEVSPLYLEALLGYEDRWFYHHPGSTPWPWPVRPGSTCVAGAWCPAAAPCRCRWRACSTRMTVPCRASCASVAHGAAGVAPVQARNPADLPQPRTVRRYLAGCGGRQLGLPGQITETPDAGRGRVARGVAAGTEPLRPDRHPQRAQRARDKVLQRLAEYQLWPAQRIAEAREEPLLLAPRQEPALAPLLAWRLNTPGSRR